MRPLSYRLIETSLGWFGAAWSEAGLARLMLPQRDREAVERKLRALGATAAVDLPDAEHAELIDRVERYVRGETVDFTNIRIDLTGVEAFNRDIYAAARELGFGETTTYGGLAAKAGHPGMARETGAALGKNPVPLVVPCHRILAAGNKIGGFSAPGGSASKERMLALEGVRVGPAPKAQAAFSF